MNFKKLYDDIADRKGEAESPIHYSGGNGRIDRAADVIRSWELPSDACLLDIGGATGNLGYALRDLFPERIVIDIADSCRGPAEAKGNRFICMDASSLDACSPIVTGSVDVVAMLDVIEHVLDPEALARECFRVLRYGGRVLVNTPNIQYWRHLHSLVVDGVFPHTSGDREVYHGGHVGFYNYRDLALMFGAAGFTGQSMHTEGLSLDPPPPIWRTISTVAVSQLSVADLIFSAWKPA